MTDAASPSVTIISPAVAEVGGLPVQRVLPRARRRTIGAWCFVDVAGPVDTANAALQVGPHPHIGLHTVTWMIAGEVVHRDSLGSEQVLRPGQLNLMTAGHGIAHAEQVPSTSTGSQHLVQLWVAQPEATRHGAPDFAHHPDLPRLGRGRSTITVLIGDLLGASSPVRSDTPMVGAEIIVDGSLTVPLDTTYEHGLLALDADIAVDGHRVSAGSLGYLPPGRSRVTITTPAGVARMMLVGGEPFAEPLRMHWNFVARSTDELAQAVADWNAESDRFGHVGGGLARIPAPPVAGR